MAALQDFLRAQSLDLDGTEALLQAAQNGQRNVAENLIALGVDVNGQSKFRRGDTALMCASNAGHIELVQMLLQAGAKVNLVDNEGMSALSYAASFSEDSLSKNFLSVATAAFKCVRAFKNKTKILKMLLDAHADPNQTPMKTMKNCNGRSPLIHLCANKLSLLFSSSTAYLTPDIEDKMFDIYQSVAERCLLLIQRKADVNLRDNDGMTALMHAAQNKLPRCCELLIKHGADVNFRDDKGRTALMYAAHHSTKCCGLLIRSGADVNVQDKQGRTPLILAANSPKCCKFLIKHEANVNQEDNDGKTALIEASWFGNTECCRLLLSSGADVNKADKDGLTAVMEFFRAGNPEFCELLISYGGDVNKKNKKGETALMLAAEAQFMYNKREFACLEYYYDYIWKYLEGSERNDYVKCCELVLRRDTDVTLEDDNKKTVLMHAVDNDAFECLAFLVEHGFDRNHQNSDGLTPLMYALRCGATLCACFLCDEGSDLNLQDNEGRTALMDAIEYCLTEKRASFGVRGGDEESFVFGSNWENSHCKHLIEQGARDTGNRKGRTALMHLLDSLVRFPGIDFEYRFDEYYYLEHLIDDGGACVNDADNEGKTVLMHAIESCAYGRESEYFEYFDLWDYLKGKGADVNRQDSHGRTALMYAIMFHNVLATDFLLKCKDINMNIQDEDGRTAVMYAALYRPYLFASSMAKPGTDMTVQDSQGREARAYNGVFCAGRSDGSSVESSKDFMLIFLLKDLSAVMHPLAKEVHPPDRRPVSIMYQPALSKLLKNGADPVLQPQYHWLLHQFLPVFRKDSEPPRQLIRLFVCNGAMGQTLHGEEASLPFALGLQPGGVDILRYFIANCYLTDKNMEEMRQSLKQPKCELQGRQSGHPRWPSYNPPDYTMKLQQIRTVLEEAMSQPWPLVKLAFIAVSSALGAGPGRRERIVQTQLPGRLQRMLMFREPRSLIPVSEWSDIPLCFNPVEYENLPTPRPLLYNWPVGRDLVV